VWPSFGAGWFCNARQAIPDDFVWIKPYDLLVSQQPCYDLVWNEGAGARAAVPHYGGFVGLADNIRKHRERSKKSLQDVADGVGASKAHIWEIETGRSKNPSIDLLSKISSFLGVSVAELMGENPRGEDEPEEIVAMYRDLKNLTDDDRKAIQNMIDHFRKRES
jgi:transcriptional regulator with XRE-family HTH domain